MEFKRIKTEYVTVICVTHNKQKGTQIIHHKLKQPLRTTILQYDLLKSGQIGNSYSAMWGKYSPQLFMDKMTPISKYCCMD